MRRRINPTPRHDESTYQALVDHKQATLNVILSRIPEKSTFAELAELIGCSHEWVRQRLAPLYPEGVYKIGNRYQVPRGTAEDFIRSVFV